MQNDLVRYSRAGDVFHYRWAARRCLRMIYPKSKINSIVIEGSQEKKLGGEYVIDLAEYSYLHESNTKKVEYFQLKHTFVRKYKPMGLGDLKTTLQGFAQRYRELFLGKKNPNQSQIVSFSVVTNRPVSKKLKQNLDELAKGKRTTPHFQETIKKITKLDGNHLKIFCTVLEFADGEGDYNSQRSELHSEISQLIAGTVDNSQVNNIVALIQEKTMPDSDGIIVKEEIFKRFGVSSERDLYPAPSEFEESEDIIQRKEHSQLLTNILRTKTPMIIHAVGGVGKSVFSQSVPNLLPKGSIAVVYDCFGGGRYLNRSEPRHRYRDALVQIANELASQGLCEPLIVLSYTLEDQILKSFILRINTAISTLRKVTKDATLIILVDAADNAEMAAKRYGDPCFIHELMQEHLPDGCRLVALCRTERLNLLEPSDDIPQFELPSFSVEETILHLKKYYPNATVEDGIEFYRLSNNGNPRVQANALSLRMKTITETLVSLGPSGITVERQIESQLNSAISKVKKHLPVDYHKNIDSICAGLASLPPFIPIYVLASAANVDERIIKSFVADLGRPLWLSDTSIQFRDEPTETWFREKFSASFDQITSYISSLKPLAQQYTYVAEALPSLFLQAKMYSELINLALSDELLPTDNPIDERNVRVYRLQFAFKAAMRLKRFAEATKLSLRAGEEVAGEKRQLELLMKNIDLIAPLQSEQKVQELAFRHLLRGSWNGSENIYSASLLSSVNDFKGEARGYLRSANRWLSLYFEARNKDNQRDNIEDDIVEMAFAFFNLLNIDETVNFLLKWRPPEFTYRVTKRLIKRLIDSNKFSEIDEMSRLCLSEKKLNNQFMMIAITHELLEVGRFPDASSLENCLNLLTTGRIRIPRSSHYSHDNTNASSIVSFAEACAVKNLSKTKILHLLKYYFPNRSPRWIYENFDYEKRNTYLRSIALKYVLNNNFVPILEAHLPKEILENNKKNRNEEEIKKFKEIIGGLLPWYILRSDIMINSPTNFFDKMEKAKQQSKEALVHRWRDNDTVPYEISRLYIDILTFLQHTGTIQIMDFFNKWLKENKQIRIQDLLHVVRNTYRLNHLSHIAPQLEKIAYDIISTSTIEYAETRAEWYIELARAVLPESLEDARGYFNYAIEVISKFGDEIVQRWDAIVKLAHRGSKEGYASPEIAYRFIRCAELVGDNVDREKHWDRDEAIKVCARLSPNAALAAISRWRDRDVGWFKDQLYPLAVEIVSNKNVNASVAWSFSAFLQGYRLDEFLSHCLKKESLFSKRQQMLAQAIHDLRSSDTEEKVWYKLKEIAQNYSHKSLELESIISSIMESQVNPKANKKAESLFPKFDKREIIDWNKIFTGLELTTSSGINQAIKRFDLIKDDPKFYQFHTSFWSEIYKRIHVSKCLEFIQALFITQNLNIHDFQDAFYFMPESWGQRVSVKRKWKDILKSIGSQFAIEFTNHYLLNHFIYDILKDDNALPIIREGIIEGLSNNSDLADASTFFGLTEILIPYISPVESIELVDFALKRLELHIDGDYADGNWSSWLTPPEDICIAFSGFVWAALGSPQIKIRWQAAHCVRRLADMNCEREIDSLINWMINDNVDSFGSQKFPFYNLHARLYLFIAFARISIDKPEILKKHANIFLENALYGLPHILMKKFASEIALNIERTFPNTFESDIVNRLQKVCISQMPKREMKYEEIVDIPLDIKSTIDKTTEFNHGWDIEHYWFESLGRVFGISEKQISEIATDVIINEWDIKTDENYITDPRSYIWRSSRNERETYHSHGEYPSTDAYNFYLSYHSMFVVASKLIDRMPVIHINNWYDNEWDEWLKQHSLTRRDGRWLADRRDALPLKRRKWLYEKETDNWPSEITINDFLDGLIFKQKGELWLNVSGSSSDGDNERHESISFASALVSPIVSQSLLNALATCSDPHDFKLPEYNEKEMEFNVVPFMLKGWIWHKYTENYLDGFDPYSGEISFPPFQVGKSIRELLNVSADSEQRIWSKDGQNEPCLRCEIWSSDKVRHNEERPRGGIKLSASLEVLQNLCRLKKSELIFEIQIKRRFKHKYYTRDSNVTDYKAPYWKIFILSSDGRLRDENKYYKFGKEISQGI